MGYLPYQLLQDFFHQQQYLTQTKSLDQIVSMRSSGLWPWHSGTHGIIIGSPTIRYAYRYSKQKNMKKTTVHHHHHHHHQHHPFSRNYSQKNIEKKTKRHKWMERCPRCLLLSVDLRSCRWMASSSRASTKWHGEMMAEGVVKIVATSHDQKNPKGSWGREILYFREI